MLRFIILCIWVFCLHACLNHVCILCPLRPEEVVSYLGTEIINGSETPCVCQVLLREQLPVLLMAEPSSLFALYFVVIYVAMAYLKWS